MAGYNENYGAFKGLFASDLNREHVMRLGLYFDFPSAAMDKLKYESNPEITFITLLEEKGKINSSDISKLTNALNKIHLEGIAEKANKLFQTFGAKTRNEEIPDTATEASRQSDKQSDKFIDEPWYYGALPEENAEELFGAEGDFIVRLKTGASGSYVITCKSEMKWKHISIFSTDDGAYQLEDGSFSTIQDLIHHYMSTLTPLTKETMAIIKRPICKVKEEYDLQYKDITLGAYLGKGRYGKVHAGTLKKRAVAVKSCKGFFAKRRRFTEANILRKCNHPNIVGLIGVATDGQSAFIVVELISGGVLKEVLNSATNNLTFGDLIKISSDAASGMAYLEKKNIIHRELGARNCLVGANNTLKISNFKRSMEVSKEEVYQACPGEKFAIRWSAPETLNYAYFTCMTDVWTYGVLLWEIFSKGRSPYPGMINAVVVQNVRKGYRMDRPIECPGRVWKWIEACWKESENRPNFSDIETAMKKLASKYK